MEFFAGFRQKNKRSKTNHYLTEASSKPNQFKATTITTNNNNKLSTLIITQYQYTHHILINNQLQNIKIFRECNASPSLYT